MGYSTVSYSNILTACQANVWTLITSDTTSITFENGETDTLSNMKIIDGSFNFESKNITFPLILVHSAAPSDEFYSFSKLASDIDIEIEVLAVREKTVRLIIDRIRAILQSNQSTTHTYKMQLYKSKVIGITSSMIDTRLVHSGTLMANYQYYDGS